MLIHFLHLMKDKGNINSLHQQTLNRLWQNHNDSATAACLYETLHLLYYRECIAAIFPNTVDMKCLRIPVESASYSHTVHALFITDLHECSVLLWVGCDCERGQYVLSAYMARISDISTLRSIKCGLKDYKGDMHMLWWRCFVLYLCCLSSSCGGARYWVLDSN